MQSPEEGSAVVIPAQFNSNDQKPVNHASNQTDIVKSIKSNNKNFTRDKENPKVITKVNEQNKNKKTTKIKDPTEHKPIVSVSLRSLVNHGNKSNTNESFKRNHRVKLEEIEVELAKSKKKNSKDLLLAIAILQHHNAFPVAEDSSEENERTEHDEQIYKKKKKKLPLKFSVEINDNFSSQIDDESLNKTIMKNERTQESFDSRLYKMKTLDNLQWFMLVMDGDCAIIRHRMSAFVTFLKAALATKLSTAYDDIYVPSVFCDKTFIVNISIDVNKYPKTEQVLRQMAEANTTLIEISGEIFYLKNLITKKFITNPSFFLDRNADVHIVIYMAMGCMGIFIFLSLITVALIKICHQEVITFDIEKSETIARFRFPIRRPRVIYSPAFSHSLNPDKVPLRTEEEVDSSSFTVPLMSNAENESGSKKRKFGIHKMQTEKAPKQQEEIDYDGKNELSEEIIDQEGLEKAKEVEKNKSQSVKTTTSHS